MIRAVVVNGILVAVLALAHGPEGPAAGEEKLLEYLERHAREDGGYGFSDQPDSHLEPTYAVIGCYRLLGKAPPRLSKLREYLKGLDNFFGTPRNLFVTRQLQSLDWLGGRINSLRTVKDADRFGPSVAWKPPSHRMGPAVLQIETGGLRCRALLGHPLEDIRAGWKEYLSERRRENGSFNNTPASDGSDGHVMNTLWALEAQALLRLPFERVDTAITWLRSCQLPNGGFTYQPKAPIAGIDDVAYTRAGVRALNRLGWQPDRRDACVKYLLSLRNSDGGSGDRPGLPSRPLATFYALDSLAALNALDSLRKDNRVLKPRPPEPIPQDLKPFTIQIQAPGRGSPREAVQVSKALRIHLWGAKNTSDAWIARMQRVADAQKVPVTVFIAREHYGEHVSLPGLGSYNHIVDPIAPAGTDFAFWKKNLPWEEYRKSSFDPLLKAGGSLNWQYNENEELTRILLDDSVLRGGYTTIMDFHWNERSLADAHPFLYRYRHQLSFVAQQDAHYDTWRDCSNLAGYRTIFLGAAPTWAAWQQALRKNWVVAVRHDPVTKFRTRMHGGAAGVQEFLRGLEAEWKWWGEKPEDLLRPKVSLHVLTPVDFFEESRPQKGFVLRARVWEKRVKLEGLLVDGKPVQASFVKPTQEISGYHKAVLARPARGAHTATLVARDEKSGEEIRETVRFTRDK